MNTEAPDPIDDAIVKVEDRREDKSLPPTVMTAHARLTTGGEIHLTVPIDFGPDEFESVVAMAMQMRVASDTRKLQEAGEILVPDRKLVGLDGKAIR